MSKVMDDRAQEIQQQEVARFEDRTPRSKSLYERAERSMPFGVSSSFQAGDPYPIYLTSGKGSKVTDVDDNNYIDYHNGFGSMVVGHAHPVVTEAIEKAAAPGTHFAATTETAVDLAEEIKRRFGLDKVRFTNSGTEATMDAIRLARAATGRDVLLKIEGSYHGHHDAVMYSVVPTMDSSGPAERPWTVPFSRGIPPETAHSTMVVPFNDPDALQAIFEEHGYRIGALIMEPVMMNIGIVMPLPGYLERVRELCTKHNVVLIFDEVKTGVIDRRRAAQPSTSEYSPTSSVSPRRSEAARHSVRSGARPRSWTRSRRVWPRSAPSTATRFDGAAGLATLTEVLTEDAYAHLRSLGTRLAQGCQKVLDDHGIPAVTTDLGSKGSITFRDRPLERYRDFHELDD